MPPITQSGLAFAARLFRSPLALSLVVVLTNAAKPVLIDDTAYLAFARHIALHPLDPYGFTFYWYAHPEPAFEILAPPVVPYWLALGMGVVGENIALVKLWLFPFVWLFAWAVDALLRRFARGTHLLAVLVLSPAVLPAVNLMLDIPALALGLASVALFARAADRGSWRVAVISGVIAALAMQTKYTMLALPPILLWYGLTQSRLRFAAATALIAVGAFAGWEVLVAQKYGQSHFVHHASRESAESRQDVGRVEAFLSARMDLAPGLAGHFGCLGLGAGLIAAGTLGTPRRGIDTTIGIWAAGFVLIALLPGRLSAGWVFIYWQLFGLLFLAAVAACTAILLFRCRKGLTIRPNADSFFLAGWLVIELAAYFALSPFPAARRVIGLSVVGLVIASRAVSRIERVHAGRRPGRPAIALAIGAGVVVAAIDLVDAFPEKYCAERAAVLVADRPAGSTVWYMGHWGFQYYCERAGMRALVPGESVMAAGDYLVLPVHPDFLGFYRPHLGSEPIELAVGLAEPVLGVAWDDALAAQTVPNFYGGINPVVGRDHPRLRVVVHRILREWKPTTVQRR